MSLFFLPQIRMHNAMNIVAFQCATNVELTHDYYVFGAVLLLSFLDTKTY